MLIVNSRFFKIIACIPAFSFRSMPSPQKETQYFPLLSPGIEPGTLYMTSAHLATRLNVPYSRKIEMILTQRKLKYLLVFL